MLQELPFEFEVPVRFFEKADAPEGRRRRIGGIISTDSRDRQNEVVLQRGLDFGEFLGSGWYNDNHSKDTDSPIGIPEGVQSFNKGARLPDGSKAGTNLNWAEGYMLDTTRGNRVWELGQALHKAGDDRRLGFSIEGKVLRRSGRDSKTIASAVVRNVAITNAPVNMDTRMELLAKSIREVEEDSEKALTMGPATPGVTPTGPITGEGAGQILVGESLEGADYPKRKKKKKKLTKAEAFAFLTERLPQASMETVGRVLDATLRLKKEGLL